MAEDQAPVRLDTVPVLRLATGQLAFCGAGETLVIDSATGALLAACTRFATPTEHADRLGLQGDDRRRLSLALQAADDRALLLRPEGVRPHGSSPPPPVLDTLVVVTRDRPAQVARLVASLVTALRDAPPRRLVVHDHATEPATSTALAAALREVPLPAHVQLELGDAATRATWAAALAGAAGVPEHLLEEALDLRGTPGARHGAIRDVALLGEAGGAFVFHDDDVQPRATPGGGAVTLGQGDDPQRVRAHATVEAALREHPTEAWDPCEAHARWLGRAAADLWPELVATPGWWHGVDTALVHALRGPSPRIRLTAPGLLGDHGGSDGALLLLLPRGLREQVAADPDAWAWIRGTRAVHRVATAPTLRAGGSWMSLCSGVDARDPLPPFLPWGRNADGAFGHAVLRQVGGSLLAWLDRAVVHTPAPARRAAEHEVRAAAATFGVVDLIEGLLQGHTAPWGTPCGEACRAEGARLQAVAALPDATLHELLLATWRHRSALLHDLLGAHASLAHGRAAWDADRRAAQRTAGEGLVGRDLPWPRAELGLATDAPALPALRRAIGHSGALLDAWPRLWTAAVALREEGVRPVAPLR